MYGGRVPRIITNGGTIVTPIREVAKVIPLAPFPLEMAPADAFVSQDGVELMIAATVLLHVRDSREDVITAAEMVFSMPESERQTMLQVLVTPYIRQLVSQLSSERLHTDPTAVNTQFLTLTYNTFAKLGLETIACSLDAYSDK